MLHEVRRMILAAAFAVAIFGLLVSRAVAANPIKIHLDHWQNGGTVQTAKKWVDGNLHKTNSTYKEGDFIPTRFVMDNLTPGNYSLTFRWLAAKNQSQIEKHAHDYFSTYNAGANAGYGATLDPCLPRVQGGGNGPNICTLASTPTIFNIPPDAVGLVPSNAKPWQWNGAQALGVFSMWNGDITSVGSTPYYTYDPSVPNTVTTFNQITVLFTVSGAAGTTKDVVLALGARLAVDKDWNNGGGPGQISGDGACDINGAPYHWSYDLIRDGVKLQSGSRDRSIMCEKTNGGGIGTITVAKRCFVGTTEVFTDPFGNPIPFTFSSSTIGPLIGNDGDNLFDVVCGSSTGTAIATGTHTVTELSPFTNPPSPNGFGWELRNISCTGTNTNGGNVSTYRYLDATVTPTAAFELGDRTAEINLKNGDNVTCTYFNHQAEMPLHKLINGEGASCLNNPATTDVVETGDAGIRPCTYPNGLNLTDADPRFTVNLYFTDMRQTLDPNNTPTDTSDDVPNPNFGKAGGPPTAFPSPALASAKIPPRFDAPGLIGIPLSLCEEPSSPYGLFDVAVEITPDPDDGIGTKIIHPAVYGMFLNAAVNGFVLLPVLTPHTFPAGTHACFNILIPSGTTRFEINIDNRLGQRTIGYWRNWSSCTGGGQSPANADPPSFWLDTQLPLFIGIDSTDADLVVDVADTCPEAVSLLSKTAIDGTNPSASDAAYNMAAQLLAAMANVQAGSYPCGVANYAITAAQALLVEVSFIGTGTYLPESLGGPLYAYAQALANLLDRYNNLTHDGLTCSSLPALPVHP